MVKGLNPFIPWDENTIIGRKEQFEEFEDFIKNIYAGNSKIIILVGLPGSGKSMLLRHFRSEAHKRKMFSSYIKAEKRDKLDRISKALFIELEGEISAIKHAEQNVLIKDGNVGTLRGVINILEKSSHGFEGAIFFIDDIDNTRKYEEIIRNISNVVSEKKHIGFMLSSTRRLAEIPENAKEIFLPPIEEHEFHEYVSKLLKKEVKMGDECIKAVYSDSGGNPRLLKEVCWMLYDGIKENEKMITQAHYNSSIRNIISFLSRDWFGKLYATSSTQERSILKILARSNVPISVKDISIRLNKGMGPVATFLLRLESKGHIIRAERGKYAVFSRLYARFIRERG